MPRETIFAFIKLIIVYYYDYFNTHYLLASYCTEQRKLNFIIGMYIKDKDNTCRI